MTGMFLALLGGKVTITDQFFEYTTLLLPGNGTNAAQNNTFLDSSTANSGTGWPITRNPLTGPNAPTQGTFSPFSQTGWGNYFVDNGANASAYLSTTISGALSTALTGASQTREFWWNRTAAGSSNTAVLRVSGGDNGTLYCSGGNLIVYNGSAIITVSLATYVPLGVWTHIALTQGSGVVTLWINGESRGTSSTVISATGTALQIGGANDMFSCGYISNLRISNSVRYTTAFTPSTVPFVPDANTIYLTCQSNRFRDASSNSFTVTSNGSPSVQAFSPFNPTSSWSAATYGGSGYFDGSGDYLTGPTNTAFAPGTGDFTVEAWVYPTGNGSSSPGIFDCRISGNEAGGFILYFNTSYTPIFYTNSPLLTGSKSCVLNAWNHVAMTRSSGTVTLWLNGESIGTVANSTNFTTGGCYVGMAYTGVNNPYMGYMSALRVVKGTAVYTAAFTPPTAPLTAITNTSLLLNFTNAGIYDATSKNDLETVGSAAISTAISAKWGSGSISVGTGNYLIFPNSDFFAMGSGDFTIEFWIYPNNVSTAYQTIFRSDRNTSPSTNSLIINFRGGADIAKIAITNATTQYAISPALTASVWQYVAVVRSGGSTTVYVNGTGGSSVSTPVTFTSVAPAIGYGNADPSFNGYIQDFRITKGVARSATTPTAAFPTL